MAKFGDRPLDPDLVRREGLGATGENLGKTGADDEGQLRAAVSTDHRNRRIRVEFGKPIAWLSMTFEEARAFGALLIEKAGEANSSRERYKGDMRPGPGRDGH